MVNNNIGDTDYSEYRTGYRNGTKDNLPQSTPRGSWVGGIGSSRTLVRIGGQNGSRIYYCNIDHHQQIKEIEFSEGELRESNRSSWVL